MQLMHSITTLDRRRREQAVTPVSPAGKQARRTHEERSAETQSALVEAAITLLREVGYAGMTTAEVARRAGCTTGAMHHQFGSKDDLMLAVLSRLTLEFQELYLKLAELVQMPLLKRCDMVVDLFASYYASPRYVAIWELYSGTRCEAALNERCVRNRAQVVAELESVWIGVFADSKLKKKELVTLMRFVLTFLRSLGLDQSLGTDQGNSSEQRQILCALLTQRLSSSAS